MSKRAFNPEDALAAGPLRREAAQLGIVVLFSLGALVGSAGWLHVLAAVVDFIVVVPAAIALVVAWRTVGAKPQVLVYVTAVPALLALAILNVSA